MEDVLETRSPRPRAVLTWAVPLTALIVAAAVLQGPDEPAEPAERERVVLTADRARPVEVPAPVRRTSPAAGGQGVLPAIYEVASWGEFVALDDVEQVITGRVRGQRVEALRAGSCAGCGVGEQVVVILDVADTSRARSRQRLRGRSLEVTWPEGAAAALSGDRVALALGRVPGAARRQVLAALTLDVDATAAAGHYRWLGGPWNPAWGTEFSRAQIEALISH